jgi:hypothetical protein
MRVCFAIDVDTDSVLAQDMIETIAEADRFSNGRIWLPRPDREGGYAFYKAQVKALFELYPEIDMLAIWRRSTAAEWGRLTKVEQLPEDWRGEYEAHIRENAGAAKLHQSVCSFALSKVFGAFRWGVSQGSGRDRSARCSDMHGQLGYELGAGSGGILSGGSDYHAAGFIVYGAVSWGLLLLSGRSFA